MVTHTVAPDAINHHVKTCRDTFRNLHYMAPEIERTAGNPFSLYLEYRDKINYVFAGNPEITTATDIYAFGICALEVFGVLSHPLHHVVLVTDCDVWWTVGVIVGLHRLARDHSTCRRCPRTP